MKIVAPFAVVAVVLSTSAVGMPRESKFNLLLASASGNSVGCTRDTECKGDRICVQGACQAPAPTSAPAYVPNTSPPSAAGRVGPGVTDQQRYFQLEQQIQALEQTKPSVVGGIVITSIGGALFVTGLIVFLAVDIVIGVVVMLLSALPLGIGIGLWSINGSRADQADRQIQILQTEKRSLNVQSDYLVPAPVPLLTVARF